MSEQTASVSPETQSTIAPDAFRWITRLWPLAVLFHLAGNDGHLLVLTRVGIMQIPFAIAAVMMLARPTPMRAFALAALHLPVVYFKFPVVGNHEVLLLLVNLAILISVATLAPSGRTNEWISRAVPAMRWVLLIGYSAIAFSKLNSGFVDRAVSCAVVFGDEFADWVNVSVSESAVLATFVIALTLIAELSIPVLLMIRRTRHAGIILGLVFHTILALEPNGHVFDFTSVLFVLFPLFLTPQASEQVSGAIDRAYEAYKPNRLVVTAIALAVCNVLIYRARVNGLAVPWWLVEFPLWLAYAGFLLRTILPTAASTSSRSSKMRLAFAPALAVVVLLTSLNAIAPYTELRTSGAFNMYSNLNTSAGETNHFLLPGTLPLRDEPKLYEYIGDATSDESALLAFYETNGFVVPRANLAMWADNHPNDHTLVRPIDGGEVVPVSSLATGSAGGLLDRIFYIRAVDRNDPRACARTWGPAH